MKATKKLNDYEQSIKTIDLFFGWYDANGEDINSTERTDEKALLMTTAIKQLKKEGWEIEEQKHTREGFNTVTMIRRIIE